MLKTAYTMRKSTFDLLYYHILRLSIGILLPHLQPATHNDEPKKSPTLLLIPFFLSAGVFAILIPRRHMAVIMKAKKQAYKMVCSP